MDVVTLGNEVLREKAKPVETFDQALEDTVRQMIVLMREKKGVGLAAPQVGISRRFFVTEAVDDRPRVFVNPEIIETSQETVNGEEGCLSLPGVWANVARPYSVKVQAQDTTGKIFHLNAEGWLARIILHENDHLNGLLFVDRLPQNIKNKVISKYEKMSHNK
ncbi:MAG: peptide deformylase [Spirochaetia bacterium]|nr:peptide deformylase [Spirochaetia bacterium]MBR3671130.1 peptide deformylase [Spirochaetia bacterium]